MKKLALLLSTLLFANVASAELSDYAKELLNNMKIVDAKMQNAIADKSCQIDNDCSTIAYGKRACGGPATFLVYSTAASDAAEVTVLAGEYTSLNHAYNIEAQVISICSIAMKPTVGCVQNTCQAVH